MNKYLDPAHIEAIKNEMIADMDKLISEFMEKIKKSDEKIFECKIDPESEIDLDDEKDHNSLLIADLADYMKIKNLIVQGNYKTAGETIELLDTSARDYIPDLVYEQLCEDL